MLVYIVIIILFLIFCASFYAYHQAFFVSNKQKQTGAHLDASRDLKIAEHINNMVSKFDATPSEWVCIKAKDNTILKARYYEINKGAPLHIQFHGYRGSSSRDFCGGAMLAQSRGHNTLVVEQRAHGKSGGHTVTFGIKERYDCLSWIEYANKRFGNDTPIILSGISMGGATVLMAAKFKLPKNIKGIIVDSPFSCPAQIIKKVSSSIIKLPTDLIFAFIRLGGLIFGRFDICSADAFEGIKSNDLPILIIHGDSDTFVPCEMSKDLYKQSISKNKKLAIFEGADHGFSYIVDPKRYESLFDEFISEVL